MYLIIAYRWGDNLVLKKYDDFESNKKVKHSYPVGVYNVKETAIRIAESEKSDRGNKYECVIFKIEKDQRINPRDVVYSTFKEHEEYI